MKFAFFLLTFLLLVGCASRQEMIPSVELNTAIDERKDIIPGEMEILTSESGERRIEVICPQGKKSDFQLIKITESRNINQFLELVLVFQNQKSDQETTGEYKVQFFSSIGQPVGTPIGWDPIFFKSSETKHITVTSTQNEASYYKIFYQSKKKSKEFSQ